MVVGVLSLGSKGRPKMTAPLLTPLAWAVLKPFPSITTAALPSPVAVAALLLPLPAMVAVLRVPVAVAVLLLPPVAVAELLSPVTNALLWSPTVAVAVLPAPRGDRHRTGTVRGRRVALSRRALPSPSSTRSYFVRGPDHSPG